MSPSRTEDRPLHGHRRAGLRALAGFLGAERGTALIEFAIVAPVLTAAYLGGFAVTQGMMTDRHLTVVARTIGDLVSQEPAVVTASSLANDFDAARAIMVPYSSTANLLRMRVSSVRITSANHACVEWSVGPSGSSWLRQAGENVDALVPSGVRTAGTYLVLPEVEYDYTPVVGQSIVAPLTMDEHFLMRPRFVDQITFYNQPTTEPCPDPK